MIRLDEIIPIANGIVLPTGIIGITPLLTGCKKPDSYH